MLRLKIIGKPIIANISNHHVHLSEEDLFRLFGKYHKIRKLVDLVQPGQFACKEKVTLVGPKGMISKVRVIGPLRFKTQVEISRTDGFRLGIKPPLRNSGDLEGASPIKIVGTNGEINLKQNCIVVRRHIHMTPKDSQIYKVKKGDKVYVKVDGERGLIFDNVQIRVREDFALECQLDTDEANACGLNNRDKVRIVCFEER